MRPGVSRRFWAISATVAVVAFWATLLIPAPYFILSPGNALDLSQAIVVDGHPAARDRFYLTDVGVRHATIAMLVARVLPGYRIVPEAELVPRGLSGDRYDRALAADMDDSQDVAAIVAERAAGLHVATPPATVAIDDLLPASLARGTLAAGDVVRVAAGRTIARPLDLQRALRGLHAGDDVPLTIERAGHVLRVHVPAIDVGGVPRLGVVLALRRARAALPVPVHYGFRNILGSSGGLMFALQIYGALHRSRAPGRQIAGTGTIAADGTVGPIEGATQKLFAARSAGVRVFLVPQQNYAEVRAARDVTVLPVATFAQALTRLQRGS